MTVLPISANRTSDILSQIRLVNQLNRDNASLQSLYDQLSTGRRVNTLSDDPAAAISAVSLQASQEYSNQLLRNGQSAEGYLNVTDTVAADINEALIEAKAITVSAAQLPLAQAELDAFAETINQSIDRIVASGNQSYRDHFILGGAVDETAPLTADGIGVVWSGQPALQSTKISEDWRIDTGINASDALSIGQVIASTNDLNPAVSRETLLDDLLDGKGGTPSVIRISSGTGVQEIDLRDAKTLGDIQDAISDITLDGRAVSVTFTPTTLNVEYADALPGSIAIEDVGEGSLAASLGIARSQAAGLVPISSRDLQPALKSETRLTSLNGGAGIDVSSGIRIQHGIAEFTIDLSTAETVEDVVAAINLSDADVRASVNESRGIIEIQALREGEDFAITENGGLAATALGIRTASEITSLADLDRHRGVRFVTGSDLRIVRTDGSSLDLDLDGVATVGDVLDAINNHVANVGPAAVTASLKSDDNGIEISSAAGIQELRVQQIGGSNAGFALGLVEFGEPEAVGSVEGGIATLQGVDYAPAEAGGALDTLIRLRSAIKQGDIREITRLSPLVEQHQTQASLTRADVGTRVQNIELVRQQIEDVNIDLASQLSNQIDADFAQVISEVAARQASMEASLRVIAQISSLTVLNFL